MLTLETHDPTSILRFENGKMEHVFYVKNGEPANDLALYNMVHINL